MSIRRTLATTVAAAVAVGVGSTAAQAAATTPRLAAGSSLVVLSTHDLVLVSPSGTQRTVTHLPANAGIADWSRDGHLALILSGHGSTAKVIEVDVRSGRRHSFAAPGAVSTKLAGAHQHQIVTMRFHVTGSYDNRTELRSMSGHVKALLNDDGEPGIVTADGKTLVQGSDGRHGLRVTALSGSGSRSVPTHGGCAVVRSWSATRVLAHCSTGAGITEKVQTIDLRTGARTVLAATGDQREDWNAWQTGRGLVIARAGYCGDTPVGFRASATAPEQDLSVLGDAAFPIGLVGTTLTATTDACTGHEDGPVSLKTWDIATGAVRTLISGTAARSVEQAVVLD